MTRGTILVKLLDIAIFLLAAIGASVIIALIDIPSGLCVIVGVLVGWIIAMRSLRIIE